MEHGGNRRSVLVRVRERLSYANVMSTIAVFGVLAGGSAYAVNKIGAGEIARNAVRSKHIKNGQVRSKDIRNGNVKTQDLARSIPAVRVTRIDDQSIPNSTPTALAFDSERYDTAAMHNNATNNSRVRAPVKGIYNLTLEVAWFFNASGFRTIWLERNGATTIAIETADPPPTGDQQITTQVRLQAGDFVVARVEQDSGGPLGIAKANEYSPELSMTWLAPGP